MCHWQVYADKLDKVVKSAKTPIQIEQAFTYRQLVFRHLRKAYSEEIYDNVKQYLRTKKD